MHLAPFRLAAGLVLAAACASAGAAVVYTSEATFITDVGSASAALPATLAPTSTFNAGPFTFQSDPLQTFVIDPVQYGTPIPGDGNLLLNGYESHELASSVALRAFGFKIFQPSNDNPPTGGTGVGCYFPCDQGSFTVTLFNGAAVVDSFTFTPAFDTVEFHGYAGTQDFNRIRIEDNLRTADDEYFSTYRFAPGGQTVPEPGSALLVLPALLGLAAFRRRPAP